MTAPLGEKHNQMIGNGLPKPAPKASVRESDEDAHIRGVFAWARGEVENSPIIVEVKGLDGGSSGGHKGKLGITVTVDGVKKQLFAKPVEGNAGKVEELNYSLIKRFQEEYVPEALRLTPEERLEIQALTSSLENSIKIAKLLGEPIPTSVLKEKQERLVALNKKAEGARLYKESSQLGEYMPKMYGTITIQGKEYFLMDDIKKDLVQIADLKLAWTGGEDPDFNSIYDREEHFFYRLPKSEFDAWQMHKQDKSAGFLLASGLVRFMNYGESGQNLKKMLVGMDPDKLQQLVNDLKAIEEKLTRLPVALIGASIVLLKDEETGAIIPKLIDPAHMQVDPELKTQVDGVYTGYAERYVKQRKSNVESIRAISSVVESVIGEARSGSPMGSVRNSPLSWVSGIFNGMFGELDPPEIDYTQVKTYAETLNNKVLAELLVTEADHVRDMRMILGGLESDAMGKFRDDPECRELLLLTRKLVENHEALLQALQEKGEPEDVVCGAFKKCYTEESAKVRAEYVTLFAKLGKGRLSEMCQEFDRRTSENAKWRGLNSQSYLVKGVQRFMKYDLFLSEMGKITPHKGLSDSLVHVQNLNRVINSSF